MLPHTNSDQDNQVHPEKEFIEPVPFNLTPEIYNRDCFPKFAKIRE